ncbi:50S ribosomal protein L25/general stress protein Ctc [Pseudovibrio sp. Tun.PSC04-5.I4]|uniref:50S ribosomal protein L25/general stress protein Ctc n=1 Tax=Pseudovibrio sp. Tun.PSC04-5.I4 TaxID=1798213 RepID=UPI00088E3E73|nr:50S ribosomal protein L25/general stress protein Ctc [Pseudovibrio sp. Tun.PSC04-5.I4]SDR34247.1 large subunit ribosomal protein L25 [Pseudovibrio sp. Tun.PSC04-5.I4]
MANSYELTATVRERAGKGAARAARRAGLVPAVIYGDKKPAVSINLPIKESTLIFSKGGFLSHVGTIDLNGEKLSVIAKDFQLHPVKDTLMHVDFLRVGAGSTLTVEIPVKFLNEETSPGLKRGGVINVVRHTVEMNVPANAIPEALVIDLAEADLGSSQHISAVTLPAGCTPTITDRDFTISTIIAPAGLKEADEASEEGEA